MGFERQRGSEQGLGRAAQRGGNAVRIVGMVLKMSQRYAESGRRDGGESAGTRVGRRAGAHPWAASGGHATKNRSKRMGIIPQR